jgi:hypothetical protein
MRLVTLVCLFILCFVSVMPSAIAQCRFGECDVDEGREPELTEEDARLLNEEQDELNRILWDECIYKLEKKYGGPNIPDEEAEKCDRWIKPPTPLPAPTQTPTPIRVPTAVPSNIAPAAEGEDQGVCLFGLLLC